MSFEPIKILAVDDTPENLVALVALLRREGVEILTARNGAEALELLLVHDVALALLDVQMPEMDGFELAELMRGPERTKHVPIIFVTAGARDSQRMFKGYETGAVDFLFKPIDAHVLSSKVDVFVALARERQRVARALKLNELFVGILGHDLRNPLSALVTGTELLMATLPAPQHQAVLTRMKSASARMAEMIDALLDLTRARLGEGMGLVGQRTSVDVGAIVQRAVDELRDVHRDREILRTESEPCQTLGDAERLVQLFSNLLGNAVAHGTPGTPITVRVSRLRDEVRVAIHNQGVIPAAVLPTLFQPFKKATSSRGLGLGLFISQQIAQAHGGDIDVESSAEQGTTFGVRLALSS